MRDKRTPVPCPTCGTIVERTPSELARDRRYCSRACAVTARTAPELTRTYTCTGCRAPITRLASQVRTTTPFCSKRCQAAHRTVNSRAEWPYRLCLRCGICFQLKPSDARRGQGLYCSRECRRGTPEQRFWSHVRKGKGCWVWTAATRTGGYGATHKKGRSISTHRRSWELTYGPIPAGLCVCHRCDNRLCVRPDHLFLATPADNTADMRAKGRMTGPHEPARGTRNGRARLTAEQVLAMRARRAAGDTVIALARSFGVSEGAAHSAITGENWTWLSSAHQAAPASSEASTIGDSALTQFG